MSKPYKLTMQELERKGNIEKLKRDGFTNLDIHRALFREGDGATRLQQEKIISELYTRGK